ncbi:hypothetical protein DFH09DRAFT_1367016 [Mycena vulgaris]|nr:hypothetical protein DFH09DRAFT_1367016 [Mycena vulgaris]
MDTETTAQRHNYCRNSRLGKETMLLCRISPGTTACQPPPAASLGLLRGWAPSISIDAYRFGAFTFSRTIPPPMRTSTIRRNRCLVAVLHISLASLTSRIYVGARSHGVVRCPGACALLLAVGGVGSMPLAARSPRGSHVCRTAQAMREQSKLRHCPLTLLLPATWSSNVLGIFPGSVIAYASRRYPGYVSFGADTHSPS